MVSSIGCSFFAPVSRFATHIGDVASGNTAKRAAVRMEDAYFPDERREGINFLVDRGYGKQEPYTTRYKQIAIGDSDYLVRATAIRALNRARDASAKDIYIRGLNDSNELVRLEACKAFINMPNAEAVPQLMKLVQGAGETRDVRIAAADALRHFHTLEVARTLISQLSDREFDIAWQSRRSLRTITGQDLFYDEAAWLNYVTGPNKPLG